MLVLSRKLQQEIVIGDEVTVTVLSVKGNTVRLGINAPKDVRVLRGELPRNVESAKTKTDEVSAGPAPANKRVVDNRQIGEVTVVYSDQLDGPTSAQDRFQILPFETGQSESARNAPHAQSESGSRTGTRNRLQEMVEDLTR